MFGFTLHAVVLLGAFFKYNPFRMMTCFQIPYPAIQARIHLVHEHSDRSAWSKVFPSARRILSLQRSAHQAGLFQASGISYCSCITLTTVDVACYCLVKQSHQYQLGFLASGQPLTEVLLCLGQFLFGLLSGLSQDRQLCFDFF